MNLQKDPGTSIDVGHLMRLHHLARSLPPLNLGTTSRSGNFASRKPGNGMDVREIRPFVDGDSFRHIDAMATARTGKLHVRSFHEELDRTSLLVADFRRTMLWGTRSCLRSVAAAHALALAGWRALDSGGEVGLLAVTERETFFEKPRARDTGMARVAGTLVRAHRQALEDGPETEAATPSLDATLEQAARSAARGATVFLATALDDTGTDFESALRILTRRMKLVVLLMRDPFERDRVDGNLPYFSQDRIPRLGSFIHHEEPTRKAVSQILNAGAMIRVVDTDTEFAASMAIGGI